MNDSAQKYGIYLKIYIVSMKSQEIK